MTMLKAFFYAEHSEDFMVGAPCITVIVVARKCDRARRQQLKTVLARDQQL